MEAVVPEFIMSQWNFIMTSGVSEDGVEYHSSHWHFMEIHSFKPFSAFSKVIADDGPLSQRLHVM
jgi:hypothetical protein